MKTFLKIFFFSIIFLGSNISFGQDISAPKMHANKENIEEGIHKIPEDVKVKPKTKDIEISNRIKNILIST